MNTLVCPFSAEGLRIIRPFVYQRERTLESFARQKEIPHRPSMEINNHFLKAQEATNPAVYENIRRALKPLLAIR